MRKSLTSAATPAVGHGFVRRDRPASASQAPPAATSRMLAAYDASLAWTALLLLAIGLVMVYSSSIAMAEASPHTGTSRVVFPGAARDVRRRRDWSPPRWRSRCRCARGRSWRRGSSSPAPCCSCSCWCRASASRSTARAAGSRSRVINVQPSEFMKLAVVLYAASYAVRRAAFLHAEQPLEADAGPRLPAAVRRDGRHRRTAAARARLRRVRRHRRDRLRHPVPGRARLAAVPRACAVAADRARRHPGRGAVPAAAAHRVSRSRGRTRSARATSCRIRSSPSAAANGSASGWARAWRSSCSCPRRTPISCSR